jgi:hypothetical protein
VTFKRGVQLLRPDCLFELAALSRENLLRRIAEMQVRHAFKRIALRRDRVRVDCGQALECRPSRVPPRRVGEPVNLFKIAALVRSNEQAESLN